MLPGAITLALFIFVIGVFNFLLGYVLAMALADPPFWGLLSAEIWGTVWKGISSGGLIHKTTEPNEDPEPTEAAVQKSPAPPTIATFAELPDLWQRALQDEGLKPGTLASGVAHFLRMEGAVYREHLLTAEGRARQAIANPEPAVLEQLAADLRFINIDWTRKLRQAAGLVEERMGRLGPGEGPALALGKFLRDQAGQIAEMDRDVHGINFRNEGSVAARRMLGEMQHFIHLSHSLRDVVLRTLAAICRYEDNLLQVDRGLLYDPSTGLLGQLGLEALFASEFKTEARPTVAMGICLDRFGRINQRLGARSGDQAIRAVAGYLTELTKTICEKGLLARQAGGEFLVMARETSVEELAAVGEHIRQSLEAASVSFQGTDVCLTVTIAVTAVAADADLSGILDRLHAVRAFAKTAGRNRSARWENGAPLLTLPPAIAVAAKTISVQASAA
jgi:diguanylate cyclase (GGDEF)-like protein